MKHLLLVFTVAMGACTSPIVKTTAFPTSVYPSSPYSDSAPKSMSPPPRIGVPYYLPKALIPITINLEKNTKTTESSGKPVESAASDKKEKSKIEKDNKENISKKQKKESQTSNSEKQKKESETLTSVQKVGQYEITIGAPFLVPDTSHLFFLEYNAENAADDDLKISVGVNQLLQTTNLTSTDKSGDAIVAIAKIGVDIARMVTMAGLTGTKTKPSPKAVVEPDCPEFPTQKVFAYLDPTSIPGDKTPFSIDTLNDLLLESNVPIKFTVSIFDTTVTRKSEMLENLIEQVRAQQERLEREINMLATETTQDMANNKKTREDLKKSDMLDQQNDHEFDMAIGEYLIGDKKKKGEILKEDLERIIRQKASLESELTKRKGEELESQIAMEMNNAFADKLARKFSKELEGLDKKSTGVLFLASTPYVLEFSSGPLINAKGREWCIKTESHQTVVMAPNRGKVYSLDVNRGAFITKKTNLTIVDGMLTQVDINKPSSLVAGVNIPLDIIKALVNIPAELLTLRIKKITDEGALTQAQANKLTNELNKLNNNKLLQKALENQ